VHLLVVMKTGRSQWPRGLRRESTSARLLLWVRIPPKAWMSVCCECCVLSGRGLCVGLVTHPEESYRVWCVWCVWSWSLEMRRSRPLRGCRALGKKMKTMPRCTMYILQRLQAMAGHLRSCWLPASLRRKLRDTSCAGISGSNTEWRTCGRSKIACLLGDFLSQTLPIFTTDLQWTVNRHTQGMQATRRGRKRKNGSSLLEHV
jgi:hypothetical protein